MSKRSDKRPHKKGKAAIKSESSKKAKVKKLKTAKQAVDNVVRHASGDIAVVGLALRFPGAEDLDAFWEILKDARCMISELPAERWSGNARLQAMIKEAPEKVYGGFVDHADTFDASFFGISPREAKAMDPQQRFMLELSWKAMEDAGYAPAAFANTRTGVFMGSCHWDYAELFEKTGTTVDAYLPTGTAYSIIANRVSYWFDLKGPSVTNDTACSSSLVAVQQAVQALRSGECTAALAGGVNLIWSPNHFIAFHKNGMLSKHGRSHAFDRRADGYVRGEGGAVLVLKTLEQARADGDAIYAVIKGVGSNHGGRTSALTVTSPQAQADLIYDVHRSADVPPSSVSYIEAHGTGTPVGDPIEMLGLKKAFASLYEAAGEKLKPGHCAVGSIKTNIGHLEGAAGIAGMIKVIAAMQHGQLPPNHDYQEPNPMLRLDGSPFRIADRLTPWKAGANGRLRAGVSSFGFGGTNAHALLESVPHKVKRRKLSSAVLVPLSARDGERLTEMASVLVSWLERHHDVDLAALAYTLQTGRVPMEARLACVVESVDALVDKLRAFVADRFGEVEGLWWSQEVTHNRFVGMVDKDEDGLALIKTWMRKRRFDQLAELWVGGGAFDWLGLWQKSRPQRIHLPTYPFARHRYWYAQEENTVMTGVPVASLHPLLAENRSSFAGNRFIAHLRKQDAVLSDHVIGEKHVLPGVAVLEIVCAAACRAFDLDDPVGLGLEGVVWLRPIVVDANERELEVRLEQQPNGIATFSVHSADEENAAPFCQGRVMPGGKAPLPFDLAALRAECPEVVASKTCYARLMAAGIAHGPAFRVLGNVSKGNDCAVAELHLPETSAGRGVDDARWGLHPILVDAAIQVIAALVGDGQTAGIPFAVDAVRISGPWQRDMVGVVKVLGAHRYDVTLCAPDGSVRVHLAGLVTRALEGESTTVAKSKIVTATPMWAEITNVANGPTQSMDLPTTVLVAASLLDASSVAAFAHTNITLVPLALAEADDAEGSQAILYDVLERFQGLMQAGTPTRLLAFMPDGHPLLPALCALIGTVTQESSRVSGRVIAVEGTVTLDAKSVVAECAHAGPPVVRLIANGKRQARRFVSKALENPARGFVWPEGSVAWVSGGGGGLGRKLADHLLQQGVETVVLSSRSDLTGALPDGMVGLPVDVTDLDAVVATAKTIRKRYGRLDGVFHAAGVLRDGLAVSKKPCDFSAVAAPKMRGAVALDRATADDPLTAFVLFSSIASVHGNPGQVDYAAANGYLDGLADWRRKEVDAGRRHGRTLALNWPLWSDGGMRVDDASLSALKRRMGVDPLPTSVGMAVLDAALSSELQQVAVSYGSSDMAADYLTNGPVMPDAVVKSKPTASSHEVISHEAGPELRERLVDHLRGQLGAVLDMDPDTIRPDVGFDTYGFDSIVAVEVIGRLEEAFGILPKTLFFEYVNLNGVADYLISSHHEAVENFFGAASKAIEGATSPEPSVSPPVAAAALSAPAIMRAGRDDRHAIAVIGVGGRYPGADNLDEFWDNLAHGRHAFTPIPTERWPHEEIYFPERDVVGKSTIKTGGFLRDIDAFDPRYFNISQRDAELMSPEVRLLLQVAVETFEDAGYSRETLQADYEGDVGVLVGTMSNHYNLYGVQNMLTRGARASGSYTGTMPNMVSYYYGLTGPSIFVDTMCSASSTAVDLAVRLLREGQTRMVLAGGVNLLLHPYNMISSSQEHFTTKTAEVIRSFGLGADGTILGEGVGTVLLKPLREAERDGDNIQGVILGTAMSNAGVRNGFTVPSPALQAKAVRLALEDAGVDPQTISYLEAHGSGTRLGDPIEMAALHQVFGTRDGDGSRCAIGSVKSNVAHLLAAAGIVGLTKVLLQMRHGKIAPSLHSEALNPSIDFSTSPFSVQQELTDWQRPVVVENGHSHTLPRRAGITSIGAGGMNSHIVIEEFQASTPVAASAPGPYLFVFSAMTSDALNAVLGRMERWLKEHPGVDAAGVSHTLQVGRTGLPCRLALIADDISDLVRQIGELLKAKAISGGDGRWYTPEVLTERMPSVNAVAQAIAMRDLPSVAAGWIAGASVDWASLWGENRPRRLSLPTYPFAKVRCWYEVYEDAPSVLNPEAFRRRLHPLIGRNTSDLKHVGFSTDIRCDDLLDYICRTGETRTLPAAVALDVAMASVRLAGAGEGGQIRDARWSPIDWEDVRRLDIALVPSDEMTVQVIIDWETDDSARYRWFEGKVMPKDQQAPRVVPSPGQIETTIDAEQARAAFVEAGVDYAPYLPMVSHFEVDKHGQGRATIELPQYRQDPHKKSVTLEPEALAAVEQTVRLAARHLGMSAWAGLTMDRAKQFVSMNETGPLNASEVRFALRRDADALVGSVLLLDVNGVVLASMEDTAWSALKSQVADVGVDDDITEQLRRMVADIVKFDPQDIDDRTGVYALGFDSISLTDLTERINAAFGTALTPTVFYDVQTIAQLTEEIGRKRSTPIGRLEGVARADRFIPAPSLDQAATARTTAVVTENARHIAIIGYAGRFPGAPDIEAFSNLLRRGEEAISELPLERYGKKYGARMAAADFPKRGGFLDDLARFDADFFSMSPAEAERMDPQHRLMLETVWATLESAALRPKDLAHDAGVFIGVSSHDWEDLLRAHAVAADGHVATGVSHAMLANRLSYVLDVHGPSEAIDTACSSSLVAVHRAAEALRSGRCSMAVAGGVNVALSLESFVGPNSAGMLSPEGRCKTFGVGADGYVRGEGVGAVLLKPLDAALRDGDPVHGLLVASAENHGGRASALTAPNARAQADLVVAAMAGIDPATIDYVEAHGTGTELGDPVEVDALKSAYGRLAEKNGTNLPEGCVALGSVKTMIGHLEAAAGIAGLIKLLVSLRQSYLPPSLNCSTFNPYLKLEGSPFKVLREGRAWTGERRRAAVSSFGFGGSNAHVVVQSAPKSEHHVKNTGPCLVPFSARRKDRLEEYVRRICATLDASTMTLEGVAWTMQVGREPMEERLAVVATDIDDLRRRLEAWLSDGTLDDVVVHQGRTRLPVGFPQTREETRAVSEAHTSDNEYADLTAVAQRWCLGGAVDWSRLWPNGTPTRLALPTYPFAGERHWFIGDESSNEKADISPRIMKLLDGVISGDVDIPTASRRIINVEEETA